jgi:hypothetical protein
MVVIWQQCYGNSLDDSALSVDEYKELLRFNRDQGAFVHLRQPEQTKSTNYEPELSRACECGWKLRNGLRERQRVAYAPGGTLDDRVFAFSHDVFTHCENFRDVFQIMVAKGAGTTIKRVLHQLLLELMREEIRRSDPSNPRGSTEDEATIQFLSGGLFGLLMWWLAAKMLVLSK